MIRNATFPVARHARLGGQSLRYVSQNRYSSSGAWSRYSGTYRRFYVSGAIILGGLTPLVISCIHGDTVEADDKKPSLSSLVRTYIVYSVCSIPTLVDASPSILQFLSRIPVIRQITESVVRVTFFDQFVGGDTAYGTVPQLQKLRKSNKGALFAYSVEVDENEATAGSSSKKNGPPAHKRIVDEMIRCIDVAADFEDSLLGNAATGRRTWVAVKMTALLPDAKALVSLSSHIIATRRKSNIPFPGCPVPSDLDALYSKQPPAGLSPEDISSLRDLHSDLNRICQRAQERGVKIIIDAEYSWYQPAIDVLQLSLMQKFNKLGQSQVQPLIYGTFQAYLRRTPQHLAESLAHAKSNGYALGVKLVRGAYHPHELGIFGQNSPLSISPDPYPPVWEEKAESDACYNACARMLVAEVKMDVGKKRKGQTIGVLFGTHNWESCGLIMDELVESELARKLGGEDDSLGLDRDVAERLTMGQLYGMSDDLTDYIAKKMKSEVPMVIKYVPYGELSEVMPYLGRRAIENKSMLGNGTAEAESRRAGKEIWRRLFG